jgi:hypothetical protein
MAQVNPYNILAFYAYRPSIITEVAPLVCAPSLLSFQLRKTTIETVTAFTIISEDGTEQDMGVENISTSCTTSYGHFATYNATTAPAGLADGKYQFKVTLDSTTYYSHPFCIDSRLGSMYEKVIDYTIQQTAVDEYVLTFSFTTAIGHGRRTITFEQSGNDVNRTVWNSANISTLTLTEADGIGNISTTVTFTHEFEESTWAQTWVLAFNSSDVAGTISFTLLEESYNVASEQYKLLTFSNSTDIADMNLFYQDGYTQKLYLKAYHREPQAVEESRFQTNAKGTPFFNSQTIAERLIMDFAPVPDYLQTVLNGLKNHNEVMLYNTSTGQSESIVSGRPTFEFARVENDVILKGTFSYETNRAFVACEENMEVCN